MPIYMDDLDSLEQLDELPDDLECWTCEICGEMFGSQREADACEAMHYGRN